MRQFLEFVPIALFVAVYFTTKDIYIATGLLMVAVCVQVGYERYKDGELSKRSQMVFWAVIIFGGLTLVLQDELFIKWKPTIVNWLFCGALLASQWLSRDNLLKQMLGDALPLPDHVWRTLSYGWSFAFFLAGALNLVVAYGFSTDFWVTYKLVGGFGLTLLYMIVTMVYLVKGGYIEEPEESPTKTAESTD